MFRCIIKALWYIDALEGFDVKECAREFSVDSCADRKLSSNCGPGEGAGNCEKNSPLPRAGAIDPMVDKSVASRQDVIIVVGLWTNQMGPYFCKAVPLAPLGLGLSSCFCSEPAV